MSDSSERLNLFFRLTTLAGAVFVVTILALVAAMFGDPQSPPALFLHAHGTTLIAWEVAVILAAGVLAMAVDRRQILRDLRVREQPPPRGPASEDPLPRASTGESEEQT
ncbi:MAG TPA: hypothetical protein VML55_19145 [Planctomycetaceae bacterium]|nr:hypothetical protein [Planctomycetaceae bacterium]